MMKWDTPCESSTIIKFTFLDFCTSYFYRSTMLLKSWWPNLFYFIYLVATFFLLGSARYRLGISMGSLRTYPVTVVPNHPQNHSSDIQTHKLPYSLGLSWPKCDYPKHSWDPIVQEVCPNDLVSEHFKLKKDTKALLTFN